ncbi:MAG: hypothetical protein ABI197_13200 [Granulicella sp.]
MSQWVLEKVSGSVSPMNANGLFGNNFNVGFSVAYKASTFGSFVEPPILDWHEKFIMVEHHKRERWTFEKNMYEHNPSSATLVIWPRRYIEAYNLAGGQPYTGKGSCKLFSSKGIAVTIQQLGVGATTQQQKADAVRKYLKSNGGRLDVMIHDIPSLNTPEMVVVNRPGIVMGNRPVAEHKERLLLFNVGLLNSGLRWKGYQHVAVSAALAQPLWTRNAGLGWGVADLPLPPGFRDVPPPVGVSGVRPPMFAGGEYW